MSSTTTGEENALRDLEDELNYRVQVETMDDLYAAMRDELDDPSLAELVWDEIAGCQMIRLWTNEERTHCILVWPLADVTTAELGFIWRSAEATDSGQDMVTSGPWHRAPCVAGVLMKLGIQPAHSNPPGDHLLDLYGALLDRAPDTLRPEWLGKYGDDSALILLYALDPDGTHLGYRAIEELTLTTKGLPPRPLFVWQTRTADDHLDPTAPIVSGGGSTVTEALKALGLPPTH